MRDTHPARGSVTTTQAPVTGERSPGKISRPCIGCNGYGERKVFSLHGALPLTCNACKGTGQAHDDDDAHRRYFAGKTLRAWRVSQRLSIRDVARALGVSGADVSAVERGRYWLHEVVLRGVVGFEREIEVYEARKGGG